MVGACSSEGCGWILLTAREWPGLHDWNSPALCVSALHSDEVWTLSPISPKNLSPKVKQTETYILNLLPLEDHQSPNALLPGTGQRQHPQNPQKP